MDTGSGFGVVICAYGESGNPFTVLFLKQVTVDESVHCLPEFLLGYGEISACHINILLTAETVILVDIPQAVLTRESAFTDVIAEKLRRIAKNARETQTR